MLTGEKEKIEGICNELTKWLSIAQLAGEMSKKTKEWCLEVKNVPLLVLECLKLDLLTPTVKGIIVKKINTFQEMGKLVGLLRRESSIKNSIDSLLADLESELFVDSIYD